MSQAWPCLSTVGFGAQEAENANVWPLFRGLKRPMPPSSNGPVVAVAFHGGTGGRGSHP